MKSVSDAINGRTVRLGALLASAGISTIVVMNSSAPALAGVQSAPIRDAPGVLETALNDQSDLSLVLQTPSVEVFSNSLFHGIVAQTVPGTSKVLPLFSTTSNTGSLFSGSTVEAGYAPASAFAMQPAAAGMASMLCARPLAPQPTAAPSTLVAALVIGPAFVNP